MKSSELNGHSSNRTLLELKYTHRFVVAVSEWFQSYLTGIEMKNKDGKNQ